MTLDWYVERRCSDTVLVGERERDLVGLVRRGYDAVSLRYRSDEAEAGKYAPWIAELLATLPGRSRVLDIGCGCGVPIARDLAAAGHHVTGIDVSEVQVQRARHLVPDATFVRADATTMRLPPQSYDAVIALYSVIHMPLSVQADLFRSVATWLTVDGLFLVSAGWSAWTGSETNWLGGDATMYWSHADVDTYRQWLAEAAFRVTREEFVPEGSGGHSLFWARRAHR